MYAKCTPARKEYQHSSSGTPLSPPPPLQLELEKRTNDGTDAESPPSHLLKARSASVKMRCVCMRTISVPGHITMKKKKKKKKKSHPPLHFLCFSPPFYIHLAFIVKGWWQKKKRKEFQQREWVGECSGVRKVGLGSVFVCARHIVVGQKVAL